MAKLQQNSPENYKTGIVANKHSSTVLEVHTHKRALNYLGCKKIL